MKKDLLQLAKVIILALILSVGASVVFAAWQDPSAAPTGGNADAPVNVSNVGQIKVGGLTLNSQGGSSGGYSQVGNSSDGVGLFRRLSIWGNIWADKYCDRAGANCFSSQEMGGGGSEDWKVKVTTNDSIANFLCIAATGQPCGTGSQISAMNNSSVVLTRKGADNADQWVEFSLAGETGTAPGPNKCYQTDAGGNRVWASCPAGGGSEDWKVKVTSDDNAANFLCLSTADNQACQSGSQIVGQGSVSIVRRGAPSADQWVQVALSGDSANPGANKCYGTDASGARVWKDCAAGGGTDDKTVKVSSTDTTPNFLFTGGANGKIIAGSGITITKNNPGANETITIAASGGGGGDGAGGTVYGGGYIGPSQTGYNLGSGWTAAMLTGRGLDQDASAAGGFIYKKSDGKYWAGLFSDSSDPPASADTHKEFQLTTSDQCASPTNNYKLCARMSGANPGSNVLVVTGSKIDLQFMVLN